MSIPKQYLITGGCGFIGRSLVKRLLCQNPLGFIRVLDNCTVGTPEDLASVCRFKFVKISDVNSATDSFGLNKEKVELILGDIRNKDICTAAAAGCEIIVHLAAATGVAPSVDSPRKDMENNVLGTFNMLEAARIHKTKRFIFASSGAPIGEVNPPIHEELAPRPVSPYGASKLAGEGYCSAYYRTYGLGTVSLRFGNVYGPGSNHKESVVARFIKNALACQLLEINGDGNQTRDFIYIEDLIDAILCAADADIGGEVFQIATQKETSVNDLVVELVSTFKKICPTIPVAVNHTSPRKGDVRKNYFDTTKARKQLGWSSHWTIARGLEETVAWFLQEAKKRSSKNG
jgi:UDP-glucose 4-epimerase